MNYKTREKPRPRQFSNDDLIQALKEAGEQTKGDTLSRVTYQEWADSTGNKPHCQTIMLRYGTWNKALEAASIQTTPWVLQNQPTSRITEIECIAKLAELTETLGHFPTIVEYDTLWKEGGATLPPLKMIRYPSSALIRLRCQKWSRANQLVNDLQNKTYE